MPFDHEITAEELDRNHELLLHLSSSDPHTHEFSNQVGAVLHGGKFFVASPNVQFIPNPPLGNIRDVFMRSDFFYADDDYVQWPVPSHPEFPYLPAIRRRSLRLQPSDKHAILWWKPDDNVLEPSFSTSNITMFPLPFMSQFEAVFHDVEADLNLYLTQPRKQDPESEFHCSTIVRLWNLVKNFFSRLKHLPMTKKELRQCIAELQRFLLECMAALEWETIFRKRIGGALPPATSADIFRMGCFTEDPNLVSDLVKAGLPVWFIHEVKMLPRVRIDQLAALIQPVEWNIVTEEMRPKVRTIYQGPISYPKVIHCIHTASRICLHSADVFAWAPSSRRVDPPTGSGNVVSSVKANRGIQVHSRPYHNISLTTTQRKNIVTNMEIVPHLSSLLPTPQPSWLQALQNIDPKNFPTALPDDRGHVFPHSSLFYDKVNATLRHPMLFRWLQLRQILIHRVVLFAPSEISQPYRSKQWRPVLRFHPTSTSRTELTAKTTNAAKENLEALNLLEACLQSVGETAALPQFLERCPYWRGDEIPGPDAITGAQAREIIWEICELNFRLELLAMDRRLCTLPDPNTSERHEQILDCVVPYPLSRAFLVVEFTQANQGLVASDIRQRAPFLLNLKTLMADWLPGYSGFNDITVDSPADSLVQFEHSLSSFYVDTFFKIFGRSPCSDPAPPQCIHFKNTTGSLLKAKNPNPSLLSMSRSLRKSRAQAQQAIESERGHIVASSQYQTATAHVVHSGHAYKTSTQILPHTAPVPVLPTPSHSMAPVLEETAPIASDLASIEASLLEESNDSDSLPAPEHISDFENLKEKITDLLFRCHTAEDLGKDCPCGRAKRTTLCRECWNCPASCSSCFVRQHLRNPTHWAHVWSEERGYFVQHDISALDGCPAIHLGHGGDKCPDTFEDDGAKHDFIIVDTNGIHSTKLQFCACQNSTEHYEQLLAARLFPPTFRRPRMAFTFRLLHLFHLQHLETSQPAYGFVSVLRHLTDGFFFKASSDPYEQFCEVFHFWRILEAETRLGQAHGIDEHLPHRRPGNLTVFCGSCIEIGVNTTPQELLAIKPKFRHLKQISVTTDGNFHANHYPKNSTLKRISFFNGRGCIPDDSSYRVYAKKILAPSTSGEKTEKTTCSFLKAVNKQDKSKFKGTDISGTLNVQCPHVFILAGVDMFLGEKFALADYAIYYALLQRGLPDTTILAILDFLLSYDISCAYCVHAKDRFKANLPQVLPIVEKFRYLIPAVHVQNHKENCQYLYSSSYVSGAGHFHGETAEHAWPYLNQFGGQGRQMSNANRHDMYNDAYNHWNFKKLINLASQLFSDLTNAASMVETKLSIFAGLCKTFHDKVGIWRTASRDKRDDTHPDKEIRCVYRQNPSNLPSQKRIYQALVQQVQTDTEFNDVPHAKSLPLLLKHSISIRILQQKIKCTLRFSTEHPDAKFTTSVDSLRNQLQKALKRFRELQIQFTPSVADDLARINPLCVSLTPEDVALCMPSDYDETSRARLRLEQAAMAERKMLEGTAYDHVTKLRSTIRLLNAQISDEKASAYSQSTHTRLKMQVLDSTLQRDINMAIYTSIRSCLLQLGLSPQDPTLRALTLADTFRKNPSRRRQVGDTTRHDGSLWTLGAGVIHPDRRPTHQPLINTQATDQSDLVGTQSSQPLKRKNKTPAGTKKRPKVANAACEQQELPSSSSATGNSNSPTSTLEPTPEEEQDLAKKQGWIWQVISPTPQMTDGEVEAFLDEGDQVQWFRAEAEVVRWQEEWERKLTELFRCIRYFDKLADVWIVMAATSASRQTPGKSSFAKKTSSRYRELAQQARSILGQLPYHEKVSDANFLKYIEEERAKLEMEMEKVMPPPPWFQ